jgi:hypothetical protein
MIPLPVIASVAGGRYFYSNIHRMKRFFLSMKYLVNHSKNHRDGLGWNPAKEASRRRQPGSASACVVNWLDQTPEMALNGMREIVEGIIKDMKRRRRRSSALFTVALFVCPMFRVMDIFICIS